MCGKRLKRFLLPLAVFLLLLVPSFSEEVYEITKTEMEQLKSTLIQQKQDLQMQKEQLNLLNTQLIQLNQALEISSNALTNVSQSLRISNQEALKQKIKVGFTVGGITFVVGSIAGVLCATLIQK